jgi:hypothetical protein
MNVLWFRVGFTPDDIAQRRHTDLFERFLNLWHLHPDSPHCALFADGNSTGITHYFVAVSEERSIEVSQILAEYGAGRCDAPSQESGCVLMLGLPDASERLLTQTV